MQATKLAVRFSSPRRQRRGGKTYRRLYVKFRQVNGWAGFPTMENIWFILLKPFSLTIISAKRYTQKNLGSTTDSGLCL